MFEAVKLEQGSQRSQLCSESMQNTIERLKTDTVDVPLRKFGVVVGDIDPVREYDGYASLHERLGFQLQSLEYRAGAEVFCQYKLVEFVRELLLLVDGRFCFECRQHTTVCGHVSADR